MERPEVIAAIAEARAQGDLSENAEYDAAKEKQGFIEGRIADIEAKLSNCIIIDPAELQNEMANVYLDRLLLFRILILRMRLNTKLLVMMRQILRKKRSQ